MHASVRHNNSKQPLSGGSTLLQDLHKLGVQEGDLLHMDNTVQMHKPVPQASRWRSVVFVHEQWKQRLYYLPPEETGVKERLRAKQVREASGCGHDTLGIGAPEGLLDHGCSSCTACALRQLMPSSALGQSRGAGPQSLLAYEIHAGTASALEKGAQQQRLVSQWEVLLNAPRSYWAISHSACRDIQAWVSMQEALARRPAKRPAKKSVAKKTPTKTPTKQKPNGITIR